MSSVNTFKLFNIDFFRNLGLLTKPSLLSPDNRAKNILELPRVLNSSDIRAVIFDLDQTILPYGEKTVAPDIIDVLNHIKDNYSCCILSNIPRNEEAKRRLESVEAQTGIKSLSPTKKKPDPESFRLALDFLGENPRNTVMVGDRLFTDIMGANDLGIITILVSPIDWKSDPLIMVTLPRIIEKIILFFI